jgi:hypothetical protein
MIILDTAHSLDICWKITFLELHVLPSSGVSKESFKLTCILYKELTWSTPQLFLLPMTKYNTFAF